MSFTRDESPPFVSLATLKSEFKTYQKNWRCSTFSTQLRSLLISRLEEWNIDQAIVIGLGCVDMIPTYSHLKGTEEDYNEWRKKILCQVMVFVEVVNILSRAQNGRPITMFASDPTFDDLDEFYLARLNITVIEKAEERVTPTTFVFSPFAPWPVALDAVRRSPELYLGTSWTRVLEARPPRSRRRRKRRHRDCYMNDEQRADCHRYLESRIENTFPGLETYQHPSVHMTPPKELLEKSAELANLTGRGLAGLFQFLWPKPKPFQEEDDSDSQEGEKSNSQEEEQSDSQEEEQSDFQEEKEFDSQASQT
ncbi:hypothetical protein BU16DRAFT_600100 [Lophium mytilinum]|uniref:SRR1-like domain-containing protein n=1 Tax=Lophium mytilinum TaxID=390894 RepID=A0A6A6RBZ3_9PEZI|nr:hypothetical protein BU16DRAFT_600100 [Lophium mytilinum]